jgi:lysophospholipase L1-like esterase
MQTARIYIFGDSLVYGAWDSQGGWCDRLKQKLHLHKLNSITKQKFQVYNLGIGGDTSTALLKRFPAEMTARHRPDWPAVIVIAVGANDTRKTHIDGSSLTDLTTYQANLEQLITLSQAYTNQIVLVGIAPIKPGIQELKGSFFSNKTLAEYDAVMTQIANRHQLPKVEVMSILGQNATTLHSEDGVHLNDSGHQQLAELVWPTIAQILQTS